MSDLGTRPDALTKHCAELASIEALSLEAMGALAKLRGDLRDITEQNRATRVIRKMEEVNKRLGALQIDMGCFGTDTPT